MFLTFSGEYVLGVPEFGGFGLPLDIRFESGTEFEFGNEFDLNCQMHAANEYDACSQAVRDFPFFRNFCRQIMRIALLFAISW